MMLISIIQKLGNWWYNLINTFLYINDMDYIVVCNI